MSKDIYRTGHAHAIAHSVSGSSKKVSNVTVRVPAGTNKRDLEIVWQRAASGLFTAVPRLHVLVGDEPPHCECEHQHTGAAAFMSTPRLTPIADCAECEAGGKGPEAELVCYC